MLFCPHAIVGTEEFVVLFELSIACIGNKHREATRALLTFLTFCIGECRLKLVAYQKQIENCVQRFHEPLLEAIVMGLAERSPSVLFGHLADLFFAVWTTFTEQLDTVVQRVLVNTKDRLTAEAFQNVAVGRSGSAEEASAMAPLSLEDCEIVWQHWKKLCHQPTQNAKQQFRSVCKDFAQVCRREVTRDTLRSYEF